MLDESKGLARTPSTTGNELQLRAPISGVIVPLDLVPDPVFAQRIVGVGIAIDPTGEELVAPCDGKISQLHPSSHALAIQTATGFEILIHIGLDTVKLRGQGFSPLVRLGASVRTGQPLIRFDADLIAQKAKSLLTAVLFTQSDRIFSLHTTSNGRVKVMDQLMGAQLKKAGAPPSTSKQNNETAMSELIEVKNPTGLHARPAAMLAKLSKTFKSNVLIFKGNKRADVRSLVSIMALEITQGDHIHLEAWGEDAHEAVRALIDVLENNLETPEAEKAQPVDEAKPVLKKSSGNTFYGVTASPGSTAGKIFQLKSQMVNVHEYGESVEKETLRLESAILEAKFQIEQIIKKLRAENTFSQAMIFVAHQELLQDPSMSEIAHTEIHQGKSAAFAWQKAYSETASKLASLNNALLAARATDVRDVGMRVLQLLEGETSAGASYPEQCILVTDDLTPSDVVNLDRHAVLGIATTLGGATSHVAILARSLDLPAIAGVDDRLLSVASGTPAVLDANRGELRLNPTEDELKLLAKQNALREVRKKEEHSKARAAALTKDGKRIEVVANLKGAGEIETALDLGAEGVGLLRTEFLFLNRSEAPTEQEQVEIYSQIARAFGKERPLIIRTLDVGGDKPLPYLPLPKEENPFLGERGIRVCLRRPELFKTQIRAALRSAIDGNIKIMFPMISSLEELKTARAIVEAERVALKVPPIEIGIMVEVPSVALLAEHFAEYSDFFSIGSNDLTQYTLAIDRGHPKLAAQVDGLDPSILRLIDLSVKAAHARKKWVGVCGGIAGDPQAVPILLGLGVDELSVSVPAIPAVKAQIRNLSIGDCQKLAERALNAGTAKAVRDLVRLEN